MLHWQQRGKAVRGRGLGSPTRPAPGDGSGPPPGVPGLPNPPRRCSANDPHPYTRCTVTAALCMPRDVRPPPGFTHPTTITPRTTPFHHEQQCSISATVTHPALLPSLPSCNLEQPKHNEKVNPQKSISHWNGTFAPNKRPRAPRYTCTRTAEHNPW